MYIYVCIFVNKVPHVCCSSHIFFMCMCVRQGRFWHFDEWHFSSFTYSSHDDASNAGRRAALTTTRCTHRAMVRSGWTRYYKMYARAFSTTQLTCVWCTYIFTYMHTYTNNYLYIHTHKVCCFVFSLLVRALCEYIFIRICPPFIYNFMHRCMCVCFIEFLNVDS